MTINCKAQIGGEVKRFIPLAALIGMLILEGGCAKPAPYIRKAPVAVPPQRYQVGWASWYGPKFHGRRTSSGEVFDMYDLTAAHPTLPLGTRVMVTRLDNGRSVKVRVNDRGPFVKGRILDLSYSAARVLHMEKDGVARVRLEVLDHPASSGTAFTRQRYTVQVGSFIYRPNAMNLKSALERKFRNVFIAPYSTPANHYYRVRVGTFTSREAAMGTAQRLAAEGHSVYVSPLD
ncbi:MAG: septal ring lytic transglycosylase RlpA family protein [Deltaproteobacteria bacterium]|nr:septal ring lytic transglycosylase RlpA family protein [Deltaproteobacteria bacterium]MBW2308281.1 septal ring lytic transglycosylase RlpA family protein [Deltaproteobacteria bacterium]